MKKLIGPSCALLALCSCTSDGSAPAARSRIQQPIEWRDIATEDDRTRLRQWRTAWVEALGKARATGHGGEVDAEGVLLQPDAALPWDAPPTGDYACRVIKLGAKSDGMLDYVAYPAFTCRMRGENGLLSFAKLTGSQRHLGLVIPDTNRRSVFLGTLQLGDEARALQYGRDRERDLIGIVEKIGEGKWRIAFPYPHFESTMDVLELVPKGSNP